MVIISTASGLRFLKAEKKDPKRKEKMYITITLLRLVFTDHSQRLALEKNLRGSDEFPRFKIYIYLYISLSMDRFLSKIKIQIKLKASKIVSY